MSLLPSLCIYLQVPRLLAGGVHEVHPTLTDFGKPKATEAFARFADDAVHDGVLVFARVNDRSHCWPPNRAGGYCLLGNVRAHCIEHGRGHTRRGRVRVATRSLLPLQRGDISMLLP